ncbi:sugar O-acetyltransferase [Lachnospiraceae bacterium ASD3451]|nr:sugar O-acetyltransferase [Diplocloster agilis]
MTEKEKAAAGYLYDANYDQDIIESRTVCMDMCYEYNQLRPSQVEEQKKIIKKILGRTTDRFCIVAPFHCDLGYNVEIGDNFYANYNCIILDGAKVIFGDNVFIAPNCCFTTAGHALDVEQRNRGLEIAYPITVGNNVWIGANVSVLPGVTIGDNTIIGAGSVVTKDIPSGVIAVGNPCRPVREITEADRDKYPRYEDGVQPLKEWCPHCRAMQDVEVSETENVEEMADGAYRRVMTKSFQCAVCHSFIKSEDKEIS